MTSGYNLFLLFKLALMLKLHLELEHYSVLGGVSFLYKLQSLIGFKDLSLQISLST